MKFNKLAFVVAFVLSAILFAEVYAHADETNQSTKLAFSKPLTQDQQQTIPVKENLEAGH